MFQKHSLPKGVSRERDAGHFIFIHLIFRKVFAKHSLPKRVSRKGDAGNTIFHLIYL